MHRTHPVVSSPSAECETTSNFITEAARFIANVRVNGRAASVDSLSDAIAVSTMPTTIDFTIKDVSHPWVHHFIPHAFQFFFSDGNTGAHFRPERS